jgi:hypothetical protein
MGIHVSVQDAFRLPPCVVGFLLGGEDQTVVFTKRTFPLGVFYIRGKDLDLKRGDELRVIQTFLL